MNTRKFLLLALAQIICTIAFSQTTKYVYSYDANGNRESRIIQEIFLKNATTVTDSILSSNDETILENIITIYPNPTQGNLKVDFSNLNPEAKASLIVVDMQGRVILREENLQPSNNINLSNVSNGNYIMKIFIDKTTKEWMIVKE